jgi:hypothetical protein
MGAWQRRKGAAGEREWCAYLREHGFEGAARQLDQSREGGGDVPVAPILYEVKRLGKIAARKHLDQAAASMLQYRECSIPCVAMREDGRPEWMVLLRANDLMEMINELIRLRALE